MANQGIQIVVENFKNMREVKNRRQRRNTSIILGWPCYCLECYFVTNVPAPASAPRAASAAGTPEPLRVWLAQRSACAQTWLPGTAADTHQKQSTCPSSPWIQSFPYQKKIRAMWCCLSFPKCSLRLWSPLKFSIQLPSPQLWHLWQWYLTLKWIKLH